jgi:hypothetical protein
MTPNKTLIILMIVFLVIVVNTHAGWLYLAPDFNYFGFRDREGVLHAWQADAARYDPRTHDYQVEINGRWLSVGRDVDKLTRRQRLN